MDLTAKRQCPLCNEKFDLTEYVFHIQEEQLKQLRIMSTTLQEIKDVTELTYAYMNEDDEEEESPTLTNTEHDTTVDNNINNNTDSTIK
jgi:hypothetical protein